MIMIETYKEIYIIEALKLINQITTKIYTFVSEEIPRLGTQL